MRSIITRRSAGSLESAGSDQADSALDTDQPAPLQPYGAAETNSVSLSGVLTAPAEERDLAGGLRVVRWTLRVFRGAGRAGSDLIDCLALDPDLQERALTWTPGCELAVDGALRRRFFRSGGRTATRVEVEAAAVAELAGPPAAAESDQVGGE